MEWEKEGTEYEAEFVYNDSLISVDFDIDGKVLEIEAKPYTNKEINNDCEENDGEDGHIDEEDDDEEDDDNEEDDD